MAAEELRLVDLAGHRRPSHAVPPEKLDRPAELRDADMPMDVGQRLERRVGMVADRQDGGAAAATADRLGDGHGKPAPAGDDADRLTRERAWIVRHGRMHDVVRERIGDEAARAWSRSLANQAASVPRPPDD